MSPLPWRRSVAHTVAIPGGTAEITRKDITDADIEALANAVTAQQAKDRAEVLAARLADEQAKARALGRAYGRASQTIHHVRCENALLREEITGLRDVLADEQRIAAELKDALDERRPAPDPSWLGEQLAQVWHRAAEPRWAAVAETAIDAVRGLWPQPADAPQPAGVRLDYATAVAVLDAHALNHRDMPTTCRCGWSGLEIHHVEHVAQQLIAAGSRA